ncbi:MAG TPA: TMEM165/GDT1 family protein [Bryobacteraceae bacterium]|jgi:putative Ca2+/H+ antiporter (TMEM165/GDT1 family)|nr:TMEM165/GDT1 family protein [Bryobacteraceae bacterium]
MLLEIFLATYGAVFLAEIVGDKLLYTTGVLAARYKTVPIMVGMACAFMLKMAAAVALGELISKLPPLFVAGLTAASFIGVAIAVWRKDERRAARGAVSAPKAAMVSFAAIFFSEWGDAGQITAAALSAKYHVPLIVWTGAVSAMVTKGLLAASIGAGVRGWIQEHVPPKMIRYAGVSALLLLGILSVIETLTEGHA